MKQLIRIFIKGGVISPKELSQIIRLTKSLNLNYIHFGSRQDIILPIGDHQKNILETYFPEYNLDIIHSHEYQNIVSSYVCADIFQSTRWLSASTYLYLHEGFKFHPKLKINIVDPIQKLIPIFNGNINFIASNQEDYWYINLNLPGWEKDIYYPVLVYTWNIPKIAAIIEKEYQNTQNIEQLFAKVNEQTDTNNRTYEQPLSIKFEPFPYYEGMNKMGLNEYWLGLYWRNNEYDIHFLEKFCDFCIQHQISRICITPWKSFIVKGINANHKFALEKFLGQHGINVRHSSLELNWHLPVNDSEALKLKRFIVKSFDQNDISTYGLTLGYHKREEHPLYFTSLIVEKNPAPKIIHEFENINTYNLLYCKNFDPNTKEYITYAQDVEKIELPGLLMKMTQLYFNQLDNNTKLFTKSTDTSTITNDIKKVYQCNNCLTIYDETIGDTTNNIKPNTLFTDLPKEYTCSVCESDLNSFKVI